MEGSRAPDTSAHGGCAQLGRALVLPLAPRSRSLWRGQSCSSPGTRGAPRTTDPRTPQGLAGDALGLGAWRGAWGKRSLPAASRCSPAHHARPGRARSRSVSAEPRRGGEGVLTAPLLGWPCAAQRAANRCEPDRTQAPRVIPPARSSNTGNTVQQRSRSPETCTHALGTAPQLPRRS